MHRRSRPLTPSRRPFLQLAAASLAGAAWTGPNWADEPSANTLTKMRFGLVTYLWGKDLTLPDAIGVCEDAGLSGIELRTEHRHGVEPTLDKTKRAEVKQRFADSRVTLVGYGSNAEYHAADPAVVQKNIELTKSYIRLMHDCGGSGVKVKPNGFVDGVPREQTIAQIGRALNVVGQYGADWGQKIRVEVHGQGTSELPVMKAIMDVADHPNVYVCWNSNGEDLAGEGLEANWRQVEKRLGDTVHVRELTKDDYPYAQLFRLFQGIAYSGWILLEARQPPSDLRGALREQRQRFEALCAESPAPGTG